MQWMGSIASKCVILRRPDASHASETTKVSFCALINPHTCTTRFAYYSRFFSNKASVYVNLQYRMTTTNRRNITNVIPNQTNKANENLLRGTNAQRTTDRNLNRENRADAIAKTYQINYEKNPARNLPTPRKKR